jgi:hypothetical protein
MKYEPMIVLTDKQTFSKHLVFREANKHFLYFFKLALTFQRDLKSTKNNQSVLLKEQIFSLNKIHVFSVYFLRNKAEFDLFQKAVPTFILL